MKKVKYKGPNEPTRKTKGSMGYDLKAIKQVHIGAGETKVVDTMLRIQVPEGTVGLVIPRSSMSLRGLIIPNSPGLIDLDYSGEVGVVLSNIGTVEWTVEPGDSIAQLVFVTEQKVIFEKNPGAIEEFGSDENNERKDRRFGSTGR